MLKKLTSMGLSAPSTRGVILPLRASGISLVRSGRAILDNVTIEISSKAAITVLLGPNGAGKSSLARVLAGLDEPDRGSLQWSGKSPRRELMPRIGFVFQKPVLLNRSAMANIEYALALTGVSSASRRDLARNALADAGLEHLAEIQANALSGGEQQRLVLARTVAMRPELLILDEPSAHLDPASAADIERQLTAIRAHGTAAMLITHDLAQARRLADRVVFMHEGQILDDCAAQSFFAARQSPQAARFIRGELIV